MKETPEDGQYFFLKLLFTSADGSTPKPFFCSNLRVNRDIRKILQNA